VTRSRVAAAISRAGVAGPRRRFRRVVEVPCTVDLEDSASGLAAHVELDGVEIAPGDRVTLHGAALVPAPGGRTRLRRVATVRRAGPLARALTRLTGLFGLADLCEVGFSSRRLR